MSDEVDRRAGGGAPGLGAEPDRRHAARHFVRGLLIVFLGALLLRLAYLWELRDADVSYILVGRQLSTGVSPTFPGSPSPPASPASLDTSSVPGPSWGAMDLEFLMVTGAPPPPPTAPYSHAVRAGDFLFVTGQLPADPATGRVVGGGITEQTHQVMRNLKAVLSGAGSSLARVVFARVYLVNFADYAVMNAVYASYFAPGRLPGRTCVGVTGLALGALVEIDLIVRP